MVFFFFFSMRTNAAGSEPSLFECSVGAIIHDSNLDAFSEK